MGGAWIPSHRSQESTDRRHQRAVYPPHVQPPRFLVISPHPCPASPDSRSCSANKQCLAGKAPLVPMGFGLPEQDPSRFYLINVMGHGAERHFPPLRPRVLHSLTGEANEQRFRQRTQVSWKPHVLPCEWIRGTHSLYRTSEVQVIRQKEKKNRKKQQLGSGVRQVWVQFPPSPPENPCPFIGPPFPHL